ncbi:Dyp-type peroxidase [Bradyrhizobium sp. SSUT112]|uniref:Dyp-type peroxidase n=1 Tax=Bradyrhizobium sp. SSUT112 TaxID=3040604 RepID=UPI0024481744|nr:Dyp-type peroxidase [Bradyrhizobium sp. SSUT112]MDH2356781.1 Dyp-type peroxidase [Bradyrhizobium sp. SSUT112]
MIEPVLDAYDIQGNIVPGFRRKQQLLVGFRGTDRMSLRKVAAIIARRLTPLADVLDHRDERKAAFLAGRDPATRDDLWLNYAIGIGATDALGIGAARDADLAFEAGMVPSLTGDSTRKTLDDGSANPAAPANWLVGGPAHVLDLLLIFAADADIEAKAQATIDEISASGLVPFYRDVGTLLKGDKEHFGYQDGISQPGLFGTVKVDGASRFITTRYGIPDDQGTAFGKPGQPLQDPTQFIFGDDDGDLRNGSFLVFRRLRQDVRRFYADADIMAGELSVAIGRTISGLELRSRIVGRWPSGQPLMRSPADPNRLDPDLALNYFAFSRTLPDLTLATGEKIPGAAGDPQFQQGGSCPVWAHIRKVNPRDLPTDKGGPDETRSFQMLRRGIPFGKAYDHETPTNPINATDRGLLFLAYQRSINDQFVTLNKNWMNSDVAPTAGGYDLLVGQHLAASGDHASKSADFFDGPSGRVVATSALSQWVIPTGGAFLFAPSIGWTERVAGPIA